MSGTVLVAAMLLLAGCAMAASNGQGLWTTAADANGCSRVAQLYANNFLSYGVGSGSCDHAAIFGTYTVAGGSLMVTFSAAFGGGPEVGTTLQESFTATATTLRIWHGPSEPVFDQFYTVLDVDFPSEGVWTGTQSDGSTFVGQFFNGLYLGYSFQPSGGSSTYFGTFTFDSASKAMKLTYVASFGNNVLPAGTVKTGTYAPTTGSAFSVTVDGFVTNFNTQTLGGPIDGVWVSTGLVAGCRETVQINGMLFRAFFSSCASASSNRFAAGVVRILNSNTLMVVNITVVTSGAASMNLAYNLAIVTDVQPRRFRITSGTDDFEFVQLVTAPSAANAQIVVSGTLASFDQAAFVAALASFLQISPTDILVLSVTASSTRAAAGVATRAAGVAVQVSISDAPGGKTAAASMATLKGATAIGGYTVVSVTETTPKATSAAGPAAALAPLALALAVLAALLLLM